MFYGPIFEYFDPKEGEVPEHFDAEFDRVAKRSRQILACWSKADVLDAAEAIDELIDRTRESRLDYELGKLVAAAEAADNEEADLPPRSGPVDDLEWCMGRVDPASVLEGGPVQWSQLFAVQALGLIAHGVEEQQHLKWRPSGHEVAERNVGSYAVDAAEALAKAEVLVRVEQLEHEFEQKVRAAVEDRTSGQAARAAKRRHAPQNRIKQRFIKWYLENQGTGIFHSRAQAADQFYRHLPEQEQKVFQPTNATRTLLDALRVHLRESPSEAL